MFLTAVSALLTQVLVKSLFDRGFLFLLSSAQMVETKGTKKALSLLPSHNSVFCQSEHLPDASSENSKIFFFNLLFVF